VNVGIIGHGKMGRSIFSLFSETPMTVTVLGRDAAEMDRQNLRCEKRLRRAVSSGRLDEAGLLRRLAALRFTTSWDDLRQCDLVIETVSEDLDAKIGVLRRAEEMIPSHAVLGSNTSSLSITRLAEHLRDPARFCGFHFFHPVQLTSIVEIVTAPRTAPRVVELLRQVSREIGRRALVMKDRSGSCVNVPLIFHCCEVMYILEQGLATPSRLDSLVTGRIARLGPCETIDAVGIPLFVDILDRTITAFAADQTTPELCRKLSRDGRFGKYANQGVYLYRDDRPLDDVPEYYLNVAQTHTPAGGRSDEAGLYERLVFPIYFWLLKLAQEGLGDLGDLCLGMGDICGLKLDPLEEMRKLGSKGLREAFDRLRDELGPRFDCRPLEGIIATLDDR
jgi:3-hydroxybutyryl-CoA dehydrogenase